MHVLIFTPAHTPHSQVKKFFTETAVVSKFFVSSRRLKKNGNMTTVNNQEQISLHEFVDAKPGTAADREVQADYKAELERRLLARQLAARKAEELLSHADDTGMSDDDLDALLEAPAAPEPSQAIHTRQPTIIHASASGRPFITGAKTLEEHVAIVNNPERLDAVHSQAAQASPTLSVRRLASELSPTTSDEMQQLLKVLNINQKLKMNKRETADLLKSLLTCNERQLSALYGNAKLPVALKVIIKRIQLDMQSGNTETVERLWDRLFGKTGMAEDAAASEVTEGISKIIPNAPISREAYLMIRETIIDK